ncbi:hypothetical protein MTO96_022754 [Rhipicephalus appendiculatus]
MRTRMKDLVAKETPKGNGDHETQRRSDSGDRSYEFRRAIICIVTTARRLGSVRKRPVNAKQMRVDASSLFGHYATLLRTPVFYVLLIAFVEIEYMMAMVNTTIVEYAIDKGTAALKDAKQLQTYQAMGQLVGRIVVPFVSDKIANSRCPFTAASLAVTAGCLLLIFRVNHFGTLAGLAALVGVCEGYLMCIRFVLIGDYLGVETLGAVCGLLGVASVPALVKWALHYRSAVASPGENGAEPASVVPSIDRDTGEMAMEALRNWQPSVRGGSPASSTAASAEPEPMPLPPPLPPGSGGCVTSCMLIACLASVAAGTTLGYASAAAQSIELEPWYTLERQSPDNRWFADLLLLVAAPSSLGTGWLLEVVGNRLTLLLACFGLLGSWITLLFCSTTVSLFVARVMSGVFLGALSCSVGMHVADICPSPRRAFFLGLVEATRNAGILLAYLLGYCCSWEVQAGLCALPPLLFMCLQSRVLDSPQWLIRKGRMRDARPVLHRLYGPSVPQEFAVRAQRDIRNAWDGVPAATAARRLALGVLVQLVPCLSCAQLFLLRAIQVMEALIVDKKAAQLAALWLLGGHVVLTVAFASVTWLAGRRHLLLLSAVMTAMCVTVLRPLDYLAFSAWSLEESPAETNWSGVHAVGLLLASYSIGLCHVPALLVARVPARSCSDRGCGGRLDGTLAAGVPVFALGWLVAGGRSLRRLVSILRCAGDSRRGRVCAGAGNRGPGAVGAPETALSS